jgi:hypothetical protein
MMRLGDRHTTYPTLSCLVSSSIRSTFSQKSFSASVHGFRLVRRVDVPERSSSELEYRRDECLPLFL